MMNCNILLTGTAINRRTVSRSREINCIYARIVREGFPIFQMRRPLRGTVLPLCFTAEQGDPRRPGEAPNPPGAPRKKKA